MHSKSCRLISNQQRAKPLPMKGTLHAVERSIGLLRDSASDVCQPAVDKSVCTGRTEHLTTLSNGAHCLQNGQQGRVLVNWLGQGACTGVWHACGNAHTHTQTSENDDALWVLLYTASQKSVGEAVVHKFTSSPAIVYRTVNFTATKLCCTEHMHHWGTAD